MKTHVIWHATLLMNSIKSSSVVSSDNPHTYTFVFFESSTWHQAGGFNV